MSRARLRTLLRTFLVVLPVSALLAGSDLAAARADDDEADVRELFLGYKQALLTGDGATAARLVDAETLDYFQEIKSLALAGDEGVVRGRDFVDRLLIVTMRHELDPAALERMDLEGLLHHAVEAGWIGKQSIAQLDIGTIDVQGDEATAEALTVGLQVPPDESGESPLRYRFVREQGEWRFGFHSLVESINRLVSQLTTQLGTDEDDLIFVLVEQLSGRQVLPEIWQRPGGAAPPGGETDQEPDGEPEAQ